MKSPFTLFLGVWTAWTVISIAFFENVLINNGHGYDGLVYSNMVKHFPQILLDKQLNIYYVYRIFPSLLVWCGLKLCSAPITDNHIISGFHLLNYISVSLTVFLWYKISLIKKISTSGFYFGVVLMLFNFAFFKHLFYNPVFTDAFALMLGAIMLYLVIRGKPYLQIPVLVISRFVWPIGIYSGYVMLISEVKENMLAALPKTVKYITHIGKLLVLLSCIVCLVYGLFIFKQLKPNTRYLIDFQLIYVSIPIVIGYLFVILSLPVDALVKRIDLDRKKLVAVFFIIVITYVLVKIPIYLFADMDAYTVTPASVVYLSYLRGVERPAVFLIAHFSYLGALPFFMIVYWNACKKSFASLHPAIGFLILGHLILAVNSETRFLTLALPFFIYWASMVFDKLCGKKSIFWTYCILGLFSSKIWLPINTGLNAENWQTEAYSYYLNFGPWMSNYYYILQLVLSVLILLILFFIKRINIGENAFK
ncbi:MAG: hypothetical protein ACK4IY_05135 [Chitinophagales bacterium]